LISLRLRVSTSIELSLFPFFFSEKFVQIRLILWVKIIDHCDQITLKCSLKKEIQCQSFLFQLLGINWMSFIYLVWFVDQTLNEQCENNNYQFAMWVCNIQTFFNLWKVCEFIWKNLSTKYWSKYFQRFHYPNDEH
jgi:hypothetical protein